MDFVTNNKELSSRSAGQSRPLMRSFIAGTAPRYVLDNIHTLIFKALGILRQLTIPGGWRSPSPSLGEMMLPPRDIGSCCHFDMIGDRALCDIDDLGPLPDDGPDQLVEATDAKDIIDYDYNLASSDLPEESGRLRYEHMAREARLRKQFGFEVCESILFALHDALQGRGQTSSHNRGTITGVTSLNLGVYLHGCREGTLEPRCC